MVGDLDDLTGDRQTVYMNIEDIHENRNAHHFLVAQAQFRRRRGWLNHADLAIGRGNHQAFAQRRDPPWVAEEVVAPDGENQPDPAQGFPEQEKQKRNDRKDPDKALAFFVNGRRDDFQGIQGKTPSF